MFARCSVILSPWEFDWSLSFTIAAQRTNQQVEWASGYDDFDTKILSQRSDKKFNYTSDDESVQRQVRRYSHYSEPQPSCQNHWRNVFIASLFLAIPSLWSMLDLSVSKHIAERTRRHVKRMSRARVMIGNCLAFSTLMLKDRPKLHCWLSS